MTVEMKFNTEQVIGNVNAGVSGAVREVCEAIESDAKARVPVDSGKLRASIKTVYATKGSEHLGFVIAGSRESKDSAYYAGFVEAGTKKMAARPFMRLAIRKNKASGQLKLGRAVKKALA